MLENKFLENVISAKYTFSEIRFLASARSGKCTFSCVYTGNFFATRFEDFFRVKISLAKSLLTRGETRFPRSRLASIATVQVTPAICDAIIFCATRYKNLLARDHLRKGDFNVSRVMGVGKGGRGGPWPPWIFTHFS